MVIAGGFCTQAVQRSVHQPATVDLARQNVTRHSDWLSLPMTTRSWNPSQQLYANRIQVRLHGLGVENVDLAAVAYGNRIASPIACQGMPKEVAGDFDLQNGCRVATRRALDNRLRSFHADVEDGIFNYVKKSKREFNLIEDCRFEERRP